MKGVGIPDYFIYAKCRCISGEFTKSGVTLTWSANAYLKNIVNRIEKELAVLRTSTCPMYLEYNPELDETPLLHGSEISK